MQTWICRGAAFFVLIGVGVTNAVGQPCQPTWDLGIGNPGLIDGYAGAFGVAEGENSLYVGGSFAGISGVGGTQLIGRWNRGTHAWSSVGGGLSTGFTNGFVTSIIPFTLGQETNIVVGGFFASAGGVMGTKSLARWTGTNWAALGSNFDPTSASSVWSLYVWAGVGGPRLYAGGSFPTAGEETAGGIAAWDGVDWYTLGTGIGGPFSPTVFKIASFDDGGGDKLYAGGRFSTMNGVTTPLLARWDGANWARVGTNLGSGGNFADIEAMAVFADASGTALYVGGADLRVSGQVASVAKWDGATWTRVGQSVGGRVTSLVVFNDGNGPALYLGGTATPGVNYFARLEGNQWVPAAGGVGGTGIPPSNFPSVFALAAWDHDLFVGGNFTEAGGQATSGLAVLAGCGAACPGDLNHDGSVGLGDLTILLAHFGVETGATADDGDSDGDGDVALNDLTAFLSRFGSTCP